MLRDSSSSRLDQRCSRIPSNGKMMFHNLVQPTLTWLHLICRSSVLWFSSLLQIVSHIVAKIQRLTMEIQAPHLWSRCHNQEVTLPNNSLNMVHLESVEFTYFISYELLDLVESNNIARERGITFHNFEKSDYANEVTLTSNWWICSNIRPC